MYMYILKLTHIVSEWCVCVCVGGCVWVCVRTCYTTNYIIHVYIIRMYMFFTCIYIYMYDCVFGVDKGQKQLGNTQCTCIAKSLRSSVTTFRTGRALGGKGGEGALGRHSIHQEPSESTHCITYQFSSFCA